MQHEQESIRAMDKRVQCLSIAPLSPIDDDLEQNNVRDLIVHFVLAVLVPLK